ncbi:hypothetical protein BJX63DRAFT_426235 [Aspergillus granulosus]|uniref:SET domain-containing protein n=1 Tax=Aspergillus granulosus TaxID=176169 RepID=A0ABR4GT05_9EURO
MQWKAPVDEVPNALESTEYDDWLWKREKSPRSGPRVHFLNRAIFPAFSGLPDERVVDLVFYRDPGEPYQHWCFLAEIISDINERKLECAEIQRGYTVGILYAQQHAFMFDKPGIRHKDPARTCQTRGWNEKRHKASCKLLQDSYLRGSFPLPVIIGGSAASTTNIEEAAKASKDVIQQAGKPYIIRSIARKKKGACCGREDSQGTRLLSEAPLFRVPRGNSNIQPLEGTVLLKMKYQATFFDLTNIYDDAYSNSLGIARTNILPLSDATGGLFLDASRINQSCRHNARNTWNENMGKLTIHALRDINAGQEITISYLASTSESAERQRHLNEEFKFRCKCELCSLPFPRRELSDERLVKIQGIDRFIGEAFLDGNNPVAEINLFANFRNKGVQSATLIEGEENPTTIKIKRAADQLSAQPPEGLEKAEFEDLF